MPRAICLTLALALTLLLSTTTEAAERWMRWTAPTDNVGVTQYYLRYSESADTANMGAWWGAAVPVGSLPAPSAAGERDSVLVHLAPGSYYFNLRSSDAAGNLSGYSNVAAVFVAEPPDTQPPAAVGDLEVVVWPNPASDGRFHSETEMEVRE